MKPGKRDRHPESAPSVGLWTFYDGAWWCCRKKFVNMESWKRHVKELHPGMLRKVRKWWRVCDVRIR